MKALLSTLAFALLFLVASAQSPGDVSSNLVLWLNADQGTAETNDGDLVSTWNDLSGQANHATQATLASRPRLRKFAFNGHHALEFTGQSYLNVDLTDISNSPYTIFAVVKMQPLSASGKYFLGVQQASPVGLHLGYPTSGILRFNQAGNSTQVSSPAYNALTETPRLIIAESNASSGKTIGEIIEGALTTSTNSNTTFSTFVAQGVIGRGYSTTGFPGFISEIIIYNRELSSLEKNQVASYLSMKYGTTIPIGQHQQFTHGDYANDIAGIIKKDSQLLNQSSTASENSDEIISILNCSDLDDNEYLVIGNDGESTAFMNELGLLCNVKELMQRTWRADHQGDVGTVQLRFDLSEVDCDGTLVQLMIDDEGDGFSNDQPISGTYQEPYLTYNFITIPDDAIFSLVQKVDTWFAVSSGNTSDPIWSDHPGGDAIAVADWCDQVNIIIPDGFTVTADNNLECNNFEIESGGTFVASTHELSIKGDISIDGTLDCGTGTILLTNDQDQYITSASALDLYNLTSNCSATVYVGGAGVRMKSLLQVNNGTFNTGGLLTLLSNASSQGAIGPLTSGVLAGNVTVQRFHQRTSTGWVSLGNCIQSKTLNDWNDDLLLTGFTGSDLPSYGFNNVQYYDEPTSGGTNSGFFGVLSVNHSISDKSGFFVYMSTGAMNVDVDGAIFQGNQNLPVSFTNTLNPTADGWSLVSNPYPCAIDWNSTAWSKTNINDAVYVWNATNAQHSSYVAGVSTNGGSNIIPSSQAFFVVANAASPELIIEEDAKSTTSQGTFKNTSIESPIIRLHIADQMMSDEVVIRFSHEAKNTFDGNLDAYKMKSLDPAAPTLTLFDSDKTAYAIQSVPFDDEVIIPICIQTEKGTRTPFIWEGISALWQYNVYLEEISSAMTVDLNTVKQLELKSNTAEVNTPNYRLIFSKKKVNTTQLKKPIAYYAQGNITIQYTAVDNASMNIAVYNMYGQEVLQRQEVRTEQSIIQIPFDAAQGQYLLHLSQDNQTKVVPIQVH